MEMTFPSSLRNYHSYRQEGVFAPMGEPRAPIPPRETKGEKRKRILKEIEANWARREAIINDVDDQYRQPLRIIARITFIKMYPELKKVQKQQEQDFKKWHRNLPPHCIQASSYGELEGISRLLGQEIPTAFYHSTARSVFRSYAYYHDLSHHPDQKKPCKFTRGDRHHMEHHKDVNRIVDHPELLPSIYHKFMRDMNKLKLNTKKKEQQVAGDLLKEKNKVMPFPLYVTFGETPKPCFMHPSFAPYKIGSNPKLPERKRYKLPISLKIRELELCFPDLCRPRKKDSPDFPSCPAYPANPPSCSILYGSPAPSEESNPNIQMEELSFIEDMSSTDPH